MHFELASSLSYQVHVYTFSHEATDRFYLERAVGLKDLVFLTNEQVKNPVASGRSGTGLQVTIFLCFGSVFQN